MAKNIVIGLSKSDCLARGGSYDGSSGACVLPTTVKHGKGKHKGQLLHHNLSFKALGRSLKKAGKDVGNFAKKVEEESAKWIKKNGEDLIFTPIILFKIPMQAELKRRGIETDGTLRDMVTKFHEHVVKK